MAEANPPFDSGCRAPLSRRQFVKTLGTATLAASAPLIGQRQPWAAPTSGGPSRSATTETAVARFYTSLTDEQRKRLCFPFDHPKRSQVHNHWAIVKPTIGDLSGEQQALCREIFKDLCSEEGYDRFQRQMDDDYGGFESYHVAVFGEPATDRPLEWVLTGRHATLRADGNGRKGASFGGPIFYGHSAEGHFDEAADHTGNVWWYQGRQANAIFATFDRARRRQALGTDGDPGLPGLPVSTLDDPQKQMVQQLLRDLISPFRAFDVEAVQECLRGADGADTLRLTFFKEGDIGDDRGCDIWKLEGPAFAWYYHGAPHVHSWVNFARSAPYG